MSNLEIHTRVIDPPPAPPPSGGYSSYVEALLHLIPAEVIAAYLTIQGIVGTKQNPEDKGTLLFGSVSVWVEGIACGMLRELVGASGTRYMFFFYPIDRTEYHPSLLEKKMSTYVFANEVEGSIVPVSIGSESRAMMEVLHWTNAHPAATLIGARGDADARLIEWCAQDLRLAYLPEAV